MQANSAPEIPEAKPGKSSSSPSLGKTFGLVAVLTFVSKFLGLARDIVFFYFYKPGPITDAYNYAYLLTGNVLVLFGGLGGPFHQSTVSILKPKRDQPDVGKLIFQIVSITLIILSVITVLLYAAEPYVMAQLIAQAKDAEQAKMWTATEQQLRIMLPLILISGLVGNLYGISNVYDEFTWPSLSPAFASITMIAALVLFHDKLGLCLAFGTLVGAILQLLAQLPATLPHMRWQLSTKPEEGVHEYTNMLWPATISTSIGSLTVYVDSLFALMINKGAWTAIVNSNRLVQLPLGVLLTAMLVPILPRFSDQVTEERIDDLKAEFRRGLRILWFLSIPTAALLLLLGKPILTLLFRHGNTTEDAIDLLNLALIWLVPQIPFYVGRDLITRVFYAYKDSTTPYKVGMVAMVLKGLLDWILIKPLGVGGISLATTLITIFNLCALGWLLRKKIGNLGATLLLKPFAIMLVGSALGGLAAYYVQSAVNNSLSFEQINSLTTSLHVSGWMVPFLLLGVSIAVASAIAFAIYLGICLAFKLEEPHEVLKRLRRRKQTA